MGDRDSGNRRECVKRTEEEKEEGDEEREEERKQEVAERKETGVVSQGIQDRIGLLVDSEICNKIVLSTR